ncbi:MAG: hypothetical protein WCY19_01585 [Candidatus Gastranaerophilaceae bacterium]
MRVQSINGNNYQTAHKNQPSFEAISKISTPVKKFAAKSDRATDTLVSIINFIGEASFSGNYELLTVMVKASKKAKGALKIQAQYGDFKGACKEASFESKINDTKTIIDDAISSIEKNRAYVKIFKEVRLTKIERAIKSANDSDVNRLALKNLQEY